MGAPSFLHCGHRSWMWSTTGGTSLALRPTLIPFPRSLSRPRESLAMACDRAHASASFGTIWSASTQSPKVHESVSHIWTIPKLRRHPQLTTLARRCPPPAKRSLNRSHPHRVFSATCSAHLVFCRRHAHILFFCSVVMTPSIRRQRDSRRTSVKRPSAPTERLAPLLR
ncbi:hypothetical protein GY45DRAFT_141622 [Cubamyces sp. BRFM 1775]|nr:hypothetical protein GY45DRAFT_141622 [Cubamyces sp. BRFM 1775]